jgi:hypothetical protein
MSHHPPPPFLRCAAGLLLAGLAAGCGGISVDAFGRLPTDDAGADAAATPDAVAPTDLGTPTDRPPAADAAPPPVDAAGPFCPAALCAVGTRCCESLRRCMPAGVLCPDEAPDAGPAGCVTSSDCATGDECVFPEAACARSGVCADRIACLRPETFCACTGVTYAGCRPDRPTLARGACEAAADAGVDAGDSFCARATCPTGSRCCEAARACIPMGALCINAPPDAGPAACTANAQCRAGSWCEGAGCGTAGTCTLLGDTCPAEVAPVCGCDGRTYTNDCIANLNGVRVASRGACPAADAGVPDSGVRDSGVTACRANGDCATGSYCAGDGCGTAGACAARPGGCTAEYNPVCGCDGRTYGNACGAASAGVRVASRGACVIDAGVIDAGVIDAGPAACVTASDCRAGNECVYPSTACARSGVCTSAIACFVALPFCSCTGETYRACRPDRPTSAGGECAPAVDAGTSFCATARCTATTYCCEAARACIPIGAACVAPADAGTPACASDRDCAAGLSCCASTGRCYSPACLACCMPRPGACTANSQCGAREWCAGDGCGTAGTCTPLADACPSIYAPVCGCDGRTYSNECVAGASGVRVASRGACR